jgi:hypothetical protein
MAGVKYRVVDPKAPARAVDPGVQRISRGLASQAQANTPRHTGQMAASWTVRKRSDGRYVVVNTAPHAHFVEYGTKRHGRAQAPLGRAVAGARARYGA